MVDVSAQVRKHATDIRLFRRALFSDSSDSSAWVSSGAPQLMPSLRRLGPIKSASDRHAELGSDGSIVDEAAFTANISATIDGLLEAASVAAA